MRVISCKLIISRIAIAILLLISVLLNCYSNFNKNFASPIYTGNRSTIVNKNNLSATFISNVENNNIYYTKSTVVSDIIPQSQVQQVHQITQQNFAISKLVQLKNSRIAYNRVYKNIPKGSYTGGNTYTVKYGDTLFYIAWITGNDFHDLARQNNISNPDHLNVGQILQVHNFLKPKNSSFESNFTIQGKNSKSVQKDKTIVSKAIINCPKIPSKQHNTNKKLIPSFDRNNIPSTAISTVSTTTSSNYNNKLKIHNSSSNLLTFAWYWPSSGKIIENFSSEERGNKGIDIAGKKGQAIYATADGHVVYVGNALRGYGNLIIIKHNNDYLSAYAHNETILVSEQQKVKTGQKIATMGNSGTNSTRLHFEIRYKGRSVDPLKYLPQR